MKFNKRNIPHRYFIKMHKISEVAITLERDCQHTPWGIRLVGGSDLDTPLIITKVGIAESEEAMSAKRS